VNTHNHSIIPQSLLRSSSRDETKGVSQFPQIRILDSASLFNGVREIGIEHYGALYRLKITRQGKLILNK
jgi:hemin uptake protein HemP